MDIVIPKCLVIELKTVERLVPIHEAQLLTYLKLSKIRLGLLLNFNVPVLKEGIKRTILWINAFLPPLSSLPCASVSPWFILPYTPPTDSAEEPKNSSLRTQSRIGRVARHRVMLQSCDTRIGQSPVGYLQRRNPRHEGADRVKHVRPWRGRTG
ncbi:GxxExxY protein [Singulisphaera sp. GP187]|nr:GxxExxY protein [Singulisphaera sp. GP187]